VPVHHYHRAYGRSQFFNFPRLWATGVNLLKLWVELALMPQLTGRRPVKTRKAPAPVDERNPSLIYAPEVPGGHEVLVPGDERGPGDPGLAAQDSGPRP
jgi:hypothetical protein